MHKGYKYRLYPNKSQAEYFDTTIANARKMYNLLLEDRIKQYESSGTSKTVNPNVFKNQEEYAYLKQSDSLAYANEYTALNCAFNNFFRSIKSGKHVGYPKFKSRKTDTWSYTTNNQGGNIRFEGNKIKLPKIGFVNVKQHRGLPKDANFSSVTIIKTRTNKYYVVLCVEYSKEIPDIVLDPQLSIGLDYSSEKLYVDNQGVSPDNPRYYRKYERQLQHAQQVLSNTKKGSHNREKARLRVAKINEKIANCRNDFEWKLANKLANDNSIHYVFVETLDMVSMADSTNGLYLGKSTYDNGWSTFLQKLDNKLGECGKRLVKIDKWYPSSQLCNRCHKRHREMKNLEFRTFQCECGYIADRDVNAANNIRDEGIRIITVGTTGFASTNT